MKCDRRWYNDGRIELERARLDRRARAGTHIQATLDLLAYPALDAYTQRLFQVFRTTRPTPSVAVALPVRYPVDLGVHGEIERGLADIHHNLASYFYGDEETREEALRKLGACSRVVE